MSVKPEDPDPMMANWRAVLPRHTAHQWRLTVSCEDGLCQLFTPRSQGGSSERPTPTVPDIDLRAAFRCTPRRSSGNPESLSISPHRGWPGSALLANRAHLVNQGQNHCAWEH